MSYVIAGIFGAILGSFANVLIWRLPRGQAPWQPRHSRCPSCEASIKAWDNIPLLSYFLLRGRCRQCKKAIGARYPLVEGLTAAAALLTVWKFDPVLPSQWIVFGGFLIFETILIAVAFIDFETFMIPDVLSLGLALFMIFFSFWNPELGTGSALNRLGRALAGAFSGGALYYIFAVVGKKIYKMEAMGGGDVKLATAIGAAFGWQSLVPIVILSSGLGLLYAAPLLMAKRLKRKEPIPYGPFLVMACGVYLWFGQHLPGFLKFATSP